MSDDTIPPAHKAAPDSPSPADDDHRLAEQVSSLLTAEDRVAAGQLLRSGPTEDARTRRVTVGWNVWPPHR